MPDFGDVDVTKLTVVRHSAEVTDADIDRPVFLGGTLGMEWATVREVVDTLRANYCGNVGLEYMHIADVEERVFLQDRMEGKDKEIHFTPEGKRAILSKVIQAEQYEKFLGRKYVGTKRFGLDGGEAIIPALEQIIKRGGALGEGLLEARDDVLGDDPVEDAEGDEADGGDDDEQTGPRHPHPEGFGGVVAELDAQKRTGVAGAVRSPSMMPSAASTAAPMIPASLRSSAAVAPTAPAFPSSRRTAAWVEKAIA